QRQVFGCSDCNAASNAYFTIPEAYMGGSFYNESGQLIAEDVNELVMWFRSQDGITHAESIDTGSLGCTLAAVIELQGNSYIPSSIYYDSTTARNRVFAFYADNTDNICDVVGTDPCIKPVNDIVIIGEFVCATPVNDTVIIE